MSPAEKFRAVAELNAAADTMALAGIRFRYPDASPREQFLRLAIVKLGRDLARQVYRRSHNWMHSDDDPGTDRGRAARRGRA